MKQIEEQEEKQWSGLSQTATKAIESLIYTSDSIRLFPAKWRSIKTRLDQLNSTLSLLSKEENQDLKDLLRAILSTCHEAQLLADQCRDDTYVRGNLFLRSELNVITSKIDCHISQLERVYASDVLVLTKNSALVVSKPSPGATRDEIRFFVKDLFARLKIGDSEMCIRAMCMLNEALHEDESCEVSLQQAMLKAACYLCRASHEAKFLFGQLGFMCDLVRIIESKVHEEHEMAAEALYGMISLQKNKKKFIQGESNVARILKLLVCEEEKVKKYLLLVLVELSDCSSGRRKIGASEYVTNLESLAQINNPEAKKVLKRISGNKLKGFLNGIWS